MDRINHNDIECCSKTFATAYSMSKSNETIYEADFESGKVKEIYANYIMVILIHFQQNIH
jgi:hypothetical protein